MCDVVNLLMCSHARVLLQISKLKRLLVADNQLEHLPEQLGRHQVRLLRFYLNIFHISRYRQVFRTILKLIIVIIFAYSTRV